MVNRVIMDDIDGVITKEDLVFHKENDLDLSRLVEDIIRGRISEKIRDTP